jgi:hypothetical protein
MSKKAIISSVLALGVLLTTPLVTDAQVLKFDQKSFNVTGNTTGIGRAEITLSGSNVVSNVRTSFNGTKSSIVARNTSSVNGNAGSPRTVSTTSSTIVTASVNMGTRSGGNVYSVNGNHEVYRNGSYAGGISTGTWY